MRPSPFIRLRSMPRSEHQEQGETARRQNAAARRGAASRGSDRGRPRARVCGDCGRGLHATSGTRGCHAQLGFALRHEGQRLPWPRPGEDALQARRHQNGHKHLAGEYRHARADDS